MANKNAPFGARLVGKLGSGLEEVKHSFSRGVSNLVWHRIWGPGHTGPWAGIYGSGAQVHLAMGWLA